MRGKKPPQLREAERRRALEREQRRKKVEVNYLAGASCRQIAVALGVSHATIANDVRAILQAHQKEYADVLHDWTTIQHRRYNVLLNAIWPEALGKPGSAPNLTAIDRVLAIMDRLNTLTGITGKRPPSSEDWEKLAVEDIRAGRVTYLALAEAFDIKLALRLFKAAGVPVSPE